MYAIETEKLTKWYSLPGGRARGVLDLDLKIKEGEIFGFIGPNGAGKSTTIRLLLNMLYPTSGQGRILGLDIVKDTQNIKKNIGYVPSEVNYYTDMTARELLEYSAGFYNVSLNKQVSSIIKALDLDISRKIKDLSLGNKKKVAIVQSLIHNPKLIILDEPTGGLDPLIQSRFFDILKEVNNRGTTIFFSSHILSEVEKYCHRVAIIKEGEIISEDDISALKAKSYCKVTFTLQEEEDISSRLPGFFSWTREGRECFALYNGEVTELLGWLSTYKIGKVTITEPDLEEIFMHHYTAESAGEVSK